MPTESQLEDMITELQDQIQTCSDDTISDELIREIKYREQQLKDLTIQNFIL